jgi:hypothetical protein
MKSVICFIVLFACVGSELLAQTPEAAKFCKNDSRTEVRAFCPWLSELLDGAQAKKSQAALQNDLNNLNPANPKALPHTVSAIAIQLAATTQATSLLQTANQLRTDQQLGANSASSGTTSLVTKAGSAALLGMALDTGALTRSVNGATATVSANSDELYRVISGTHPDCVINCKESGFESHFLNWLNLSASFALAQSSSTTTSTSGQASGTTSTSVSSVAIPTGAGKLSAFTAKFQLINKYDPRSSAFLGNWSNQVTTLAPTAISAEGDAAALYAEMMNDAAFASMAGAPDDANLYAKAGADATGKSLVDQFETGWNAAMSTVLKDPKLSADVSKLTQDQEAFRTAWLNSITAVAGQLLSVQYSFNKPLNQPQTHDVTIIYGHNFGAAGSLTFNGAASLYNGALPAGASYGRVHYGQVSGEYDRNLNNPQNSFQTQLSLAGYWQYQPQPSVLNIPAGTVAPGTTIPLPNGTQEFVGTAGSLWVTQGSLTIKGPGGVNIPLGVSWSNKTDLLQGSKVGGQVGISYNFSSLSALF